MIHEPAESMDGESPPAADTRSAAGEGGRAPTPALLEEVVRRVVAVAQPERIVLFGSAARGEMGPDSDLDLLIIKSGVEHRRVLATVILKALRGMGVPFDIIVATPEEIERYGQSTALIYREALREGRTLHVG